jgi:hypothetical protein
MVLTWEILAAFSMAAFIGTLIYSSMQQENPTEFIKQKLRDNEENGINQYGLLRINKVHDAADNRITDAAKVIPETFPALGNHYDNNEKYDNMIHLVTRMENDRYNDAKNQVFLAKGLPQKVFGRSAMVGAALPGSDIPGVTNMA